MAGAGVSAGAGDPTDGRRNTLVLSVERRRYEVFRGRTLDVNGRVFDAGGEGVPHMRIEVLLSGKRERLLGVTVSREHGWFRGSFGVPPDLPVGDYRLVVRTPGDDDYAPAIAP